MLCEASWSRTGLTEGFHGPAWGEFMRRHKNLNETITSIIVALLFCAPAYAQQRAVPQRSGSDSPARVPARPPDIISDNLDRVAASADQILAAVNTDAGLVGGGCGEGRVGEESRFRGSPDYLKKKKIE